MERFGDNNNIFTVNPDEFIEELDSLIELVNTRINVGIFLEYADLKDDALATFGNFDEMSEKIPNVMKSVVQLDSDVFKEMFPIILDQMLKGSKVAYAIVLRDKFAAMLVSNALADELIGLDD